MESGVYPPPSLTVSLLTPISGLSEGRALPFCRRGRHGGSGSSFATRWGLGVLPALAQPGQSRCEGAAALGVPSKKVQGALPLLSPPEFGEGAPQG